MSPLSAAIARRHVFDAFWSDEPTHALMHGPTYMAHALGCAAANASLDIFAEGDWKGRVGAISRRLAEGLAPCRDVAGVKDVRVRGAIGVVELDHVPDHGQLIGRFIEAGVWIKPFGKVIYLTPAFVASEEDVARLTAAIVDTMQRISPAR